MALLRPISGLTIDSGSPATLETVGTVAVSDRDAITDTARRARQSALSWGALSPRDRRRHLRKVRSALVRRGKELVESLVAETGKPVSDGWMELVLATTMTSWAARSAERHLRPQRISTWPYLLKRAWTEYYPFGVIAVITPWNWPLAISMQSIPFALAAGNVVINKPSEHTPLTGQILADVINSAGRDLVYTVQGDGSAAQQLIRSGVDKIVFTGGGIAATSVLKAGAEQHIPVVLELRGKDSMIVCDDADLAQAARAAAGAAFTNAGQTCVATERILVHSAVYDVFTTRFVDVVRSLRTGAGPTDHVGAVVRPQQLELLEERIAEAVREGATVLVDGRRRHDLGGWYLEPTVLADVPMHCALVREESFGPVVCVIKVANDEEAVAVSNATDYGLSGSVFSRNRRRGRSIARRLLTGGVQINDAMIGGGIPSVPFGGVRSSGYGHLQGALGLREFSRARSVIEPRLPGLPSVAALALTGRKPTPEILQRLLQALYGGDLRSRLAALRSRSR